MMIEKKAPVRMREQCMFPQVRPLTGFRMGTHADPDDEYDDDHDENYVYYDHMPQKGCCIGRL